MSKMSQLAMELDEQAVELGFMDREHAMQNGYEVISDGKFARLVETETEQDKAHRAWLEEKTQVLNELQMVLEDVDLDDVDRVSHAIKFIEEQCHD